MSQVTVTKYVKDQLNAIQTDEEHTSIDSVIRVLLLRAGYQSSLEYQRTEQCKSTDVVE